MAAKAIVKKYDLLPSLAGGFQYGNEKPIIDNYGVLDLNTKEPVDENTTYILGSCSKAMTAAAIMKICFEKHIKNPMRTITVGSVYPTGIHEGFRNVSLRQLLCMNGGIIDGAPSPGDYGKLIYLIPFIDYVKRHPTNYSLTNQREFLTKLVMGRERGGPDYSPGTQYSYSNFGYVIAAHIAEKYFQIPFETIMQEYLFNPLDMTGASLPGPIQLPNMPGGNNSTTHAIMGLDKWRSNRWLTWWYVWLLKYRTSPPKLPKMVIKNNTIGFVAKDDIQYPPPVISAAGCVRTDMKSWLKFLHAVQTHDNSFLPEWAWKTLVHSGYPISGENKGNAYSFGWIYGTTPTWPKGLLWYNGDIFTAVSSLFTQQDLPNKPGFSIVSATNCGRNATGPAYTPQFEFEIALLQKNHKNDTKIVTSILEYFLHLNQKNKGVDPWISNQPSIRESFTSMSLSYKAIPLLLVILLFLCLKKQGKYN